MIDTIAEGAEALGDKPIGRAAGPRCRTRLLLLGGALLSLSGCPEDNVLRPDDAGGGADAGDASPGDTGGPDGGDTDAGSSGGTLDAGTTGGGTTDGGTTGGETDAGGTPEGGVDAGPVEPGTPTNPECDFNGYWVARQTTISSALNGDQFASNWYLMRLRHDGDQVEVLDHLDCGIYVASAEGAFAGIEVILARDTMVTLATKNPQTGRSGTATLGEGGESCEVSFERFYSVRGAGPAAYLPMGPLDSRDLSPLQAEAPLPSQEDPSGAEDWNGAAQQGTGVAWVVSGGASGVRWSTQRDWTEWQSDENHGVTPATPLDRVVLGARFANEENVLRTDPGGVAGGLLATLSTPVTDDPRAQVEFERLGATREEASAILDIEDVGDRCLEVQKLLPHVEPAL